MNSWNDLKKAISESPARSAWERGVRTYASELVEEADSKRRLSFEVFVESPLLRRKDTLLKGIRNWREYSEGGYSLICDSEIAERLCSPSELKKVTRKDGSVRERPNASETWLECQARALHQAMLLINRLLVDL